MQYYAFIAIILILMLIFIGISIYSISSMFTADNKRINQQRIKQLEITEKLDKLEESDAFREGFVQSFKGMNTNPYPEIPTCPIANKLYICYEDGYKAGMKLRNQ